MLIATLVRDDSDGSTGAQCVGCGSYTVRMRPISHGRLGQKKSFRSFSSRRRRVNHTGQDGVDGRAIYRLQTRMRRGDPSRQVSKPTNSSQSPSVKAHGLHDVRVFTTYPLNHTAKVSIITECRAGGKSRLRSRRRRQHLLYSRGGRLVTRAPRRYPSAVPLPECRAATHSSLSLLIG